MAAAGAGSKLAAGITSIRHRCSTCSRRAAPPPASELGSEGQGMRTAGLRPAACGPPSPPPPQTVLTDDDDAPAASGRAVRAPPPPRPRHPYPIAPFRPPPPHRVSARPLPAAGRCDTLQRHHRQPLGRPPERDARAAFASSSRGARKPLPAAALIPGGGPGAPAASPRLSSAGSAEPLVAASVRSKSCLSATAGRSRPGRGRGSGRGWRRKAGAEGGGGGFGERADERSTGDANHTASTDDRPCTPPTSV